MDAHDLFSVKIKWNEIISLLLLFQFKFQTVKVLIETIKANKKNKYHFEQKY